MIIFTRITRTGGTSFWWGIHGNFTSEECWQKGVFAKKQYASIGGIVGGLQLGKRFDLVPKMFMHHLPYGVHRLFKTARYSYITFLREPIARTISAFKYATALKYNSEYEKRLSREGYFEKQLFLQGYLKDCKDIGTVLKRCIKRETSCNIMTKQLSGAEDFGNMRSTYAWRAGNLYPVNHTNVRRYTDKEMEDMLVKAKFNLKNYIFLGFQENGTADHKKVCKTLGLKYNDHAIAYKGYEGEPLADVNWNAEQVQELLVDMNRYDLKLYEFARGLRYEHESKNSD